MNTFLPAMLFKSVSLAAQNATISPGVLQPWIDEILAKVATDGKFTKSAVAYIPISPPPVFWDYKCRKCFFWVEPNTCQVVDGVISPIGWCVIWLPPDDKPAFSWPNEFMRGDW